MIVPTKGIAPDRSLLAIGAQIVMQLDQPRTVGQAWSRLREWRKNNDHLAPVSFGWFVLALDTMYALGAVELRNDLLVRRPVDAQPAQC